MSNLILLTFSQSRCVDLEVRADKWLADDSYEISLAVLHQRILTLEELSKNYQLLQIENCLLTVTTTTYVYDVFVTIRFSWKVEANLILTGGAMP